MKKTISLILVLALGLPSVSLAAEDRWMKKADMLTARMFLSTSVVDGRIYAIGGQSTAGTFSTVEEYDPKTDTWTTKAEMPTARCGLSTSVVDGNIYAIGGVSYWDSTGRAPLATVEQYDPATDTWTKKADIPTARSWLSTSVVGGKIYAIGGSRAGFNVLSAVEEYDPVTDIWTPKARMPTARDGLSTSEVDGNIYAMGGYGGYFTVEQYDPATDIWTRRASMPTGRCDLCTSVLGAKIYAIGGITAGFEVLSAVEEYDPLIDTWTKKSGMPMAIWGLSTSVFHGKIYAIGGGTERWPSSVSVSTVKEYDPNPLVVDFNGDGIVNSTDMRIMVDHWGENYPLCDIGPMPWGDGIVDVQDLIVLAEYLFGDMRSVAHFKLDEAKGSIANDSDRNRDGTVHGGPEWRPVGGVVGGALQLDGVDDYVRTGFVLNPADGALSVFAWIKGGAPGQVVLSQIGGVNWLCADTLEGNLMTALKAPGRGAAILPSQEVITDGNWHRIGLVWDGSHRTLYVDGVAVAEDTQANLRASENGLYIGTGKAMETGSFWSGLIDDVRIYNRAVTP